MKRRSAIKTDLFADDHHRKKIDTLGDPLAEIESHIDFGALAAEVDRVELIEQGAIPADWKPAKRRQKDINATWTKKLGKSSSNFRCCTTQGGIADIDEMAYWCYGDNVNTHHTETGCEQTDHYAG